MPPLQRGAALCLAGGVYLSQLFSPSRFNPSDDPTRHRSVRPALRERPDWFDDDGVLQWLLALPPAAAVPGAWLRLCFRLWTVADFRALRAAASGARRAPSRHVFSGLPRCGRRLDVLGRLLPVRARDIGRSLRGLNEANDCPEGTAAALAPTAFDSTLGFPGEGPARLASGPAEPVVPVGEAGQPRKCRYEVPLDYGRYGRPRRAAKDPPFARRRASPLPEGRPLGGHTVSSRESPLADLEERMQRAAARPPPAVLSEAGSDPSEIFASPHGYIRHLWACGVPYYRASETINAVVARCRLIRRSIWP